MKNIYLAQKSFQHRHVIIEILNIKKLEIRYACMQQTNVRKNSKKYSE